MVKEANILKNNPNIKNDKIQLKPMKDRIYWLVKADELFKNFHQKMGFNENRLLFSLIKFCTIQADSPYVVITEEKIAEHAPDGDLEQETIRVKDALLKISSHPFWLPANNGVPGEQILVSWIETVRFNTLKEEFVVSLNSLLYPYIVSLHERFQTLDYDMIRSDGHLKSKYSSRLFELFKIHEELSELVLTLDQLRYLIDVSQGKLVRWADLKRRVIEPSLEEINRTGQLAIHYQPIKTGRSVTHVRFVLEKKKD